MFEKVTMILIMVAILIGDSDNVAVPVLLLLGAVAVFCIGKVREVRYGEKDKAVR